MKIIKDATGVYVNVGKATAFYVLPDNPIIGESRGFKAYLFIGETAFPLRVFDTKAEAQAWLDEFVAKLNAEASHVED